MLRARVTQWLERRWYGQVAPNRVLIALSRLFERIAVLRRERFLAALAGGAEGASELSLPAGVPVIVVGNLTVGGVGKTPLVIALVNALQARGFKPGVISRGYGRRTSDVWRVSSDAAPEAVGDEPLLIARRTGVPVAVSMKRIDAARLLVSTGEVDVLLADDGLQHYALARDVEILVIDGTRRFGNGRLLPAGPLREPLGRAAACDFIVVNGGVPREDEVLMTLTPTHALSLLPGAARPLSEFSGQRVHAVAGIGNPVRFFDALQAHGIDVIPHAFADHHAFTAKDLSFDDSLPLLMTEKDAVKCRGFAASGWYAVPVDAQLPGPFFDEVAAQLAVERGVHR